MWTVLAWGEGGTRGVDKGMGRERLGEGAPFVEKRADLYAPPNDRESRWPKLSYKVHYTFHLEARSLDVNVPPAHVPHSRETSRT